MDRSETVCGPLPLVARWRPAGGPLVARWPGLAHPDLTHGDRRDALVFIIQTMSREPAGVAAQAGRGAGEVSSLGSEVKGRGRKIKKMKGEAGVAAGRSAALL